MKVMVGFLCVCFLIGLALANKRTAGKTWLLLVLALVVCVAYYFFGQL
jgi:hypothetical protein